MITSTSNPQVKNLQQLAKKARARNEQGVFLVLMVAVFWLLRNKPSFRLLAGCGAAGIATLLSLFNLAAPFSCLLLYLYNGEKGDDNRMFNLVCYPLMLLIAGIAAIYL